MKKMMMAYAWEDTDAPEVEIKFGEHWVSAAKDLADAERDTIKYIRGSLGRQKHKFDEGRVIVHKVWDISDYARSLNLFYEHSKVDDKIRPVIGRRVGRTEVHRVEANDLIVAVNRELSRFGQVLPSAGLSTYQHRVANEVIAGFNAGHRIVLADLCARYGKTLWAGAVSMETDSQLIIVACYVKTAFSSFRKDLTSFQQFANVIHVNTQAAGWQKEIAAGIRTGKKIIAYLSLANGQQRQKRIDYLFSRNVSRLLVVDEADYGAHQPKQTEPLIAAVKPTDRVILMTGTNPDRAASTWKLDAKPISVTYPELLIQKRLRTPCDTRVLKNFTVDTGRDLLVPDMRCYQMDLKGPVAQAIEFNEIADDEFKLLPSWSKFAAHPNKSKGFFTRTLQGIFLGQHGFDELNIDLQKNLTPTIGGESGQPKVAMMFVPANTRIENLTTIAAIARQTLPAWDVLPLSGGIKINGQKITNENAEAFTKERVKYNIKQGRNTLIIAAQLAQRSFSIPEITELYLAYDQGEAGSTMQKISRVLTPGAPDKVGHIISLSFDPNRDDKFDTMVIETAFNHSQRQDKRSIVDAMRDVLRTIDIFSCTKDGAIKIEVDDYLEQIMARNSIGRVIGKTADLTVLSEEELLALAEGNADYFRAAVQSAADKGKTSDGGGNRGQSSDSGPPADDMMDIIKQARQVITAVAENMDIIILGTKTDTFEDAMDAVVRDPEYQQCVMEEFGVPFDTIRYLFMSGAIKKEWIQFRHDRV